MVAAMTIQAKCGRNDLSLLLGITPRRVTQLVDKKILLQEARGTFDICDSVHRFIAWRETIVAQEHGVGAYGKARAQLYLEKAPRKKKARKRSADRAAD